MRRAGLAAVQAEPQPLTSNLRDNPHLQDDQAAGITLAPSSKTRENARSLLQV